MHSALAVSAHPRKRPRDIAVSNNTIGSKYYFDPDCMQGAVTGEVASNLQNVTVISRAGSIYANGTSHTARQGILTFKAKKDFFNRSIVHTHKEDAWSMSMTGGICDAGV